MYAIYERIIFRLIILCVNLNVTTSSIFIKIRQLLEREIPQLFQAIAGVDFRV